MKSAFAGVDVGGTRIKIGLADDSGHLLSSRIIETHECQDAVAFLTTVVAEIQNEATAGGFTVEAAGVGCPGRIDFASGKVVWLKTKLEFLEGIPLAAQLSSRLGCPVVCDNDVNAILAGEMRFGAGRGHQEVAAVTVGTGIGGALVMDSRMVRGHNWATGHFGYMSLDPCGIRHICGNTGIVEEHASLCGILHQLEGARAAGKNSPLTEMLGRGQSPGLRDLFEAAEAGDPLGRCLAEQLIRELGVLVANLIYALDPELVLIGGGLIAHRPGVLDAIRAEAACRVAFLPPGATEIKAMKLGDAAGVLGGVALAMERVPQTI